MMSHWDGVQWTTSSTTATRPAGVHSIWGASATDAWAVGDLGATLHWNGSEIWWPYDSGTSNNLTGVWGSANGMFAVGTPGTILVHP